METLLDRRSIQARFASLPVQEGYTDAPFAQQDLIAAAVLVPLVERRQGMQVILTRRAPHLRDHAGQISFPGGRIEQTDASMADAALREAEEEIRLPPGAVELTGRLPPYRTGTGFVVHPIVGFVEPSAELVPDPIEVAEIFEVPLNFVLDPGNYNALRLRDRGRSHTYWAIPYHGHRIWGVTAAILRELYQRLIAAWDSGRGPG